MKKVADIVIADVTGEGTMGKYTGSRLYPTNDEIAQLAFSLYESRGRQDGHHIEDWLRAEQELVWHTRNGEVPTNTHDALKWRRSSERLIYEVHKSNFGAGMSHVRHAGSTGG